MKKEISIDRLKHLLSYDPLTGIFIWRNPTSNRVKRGIVAGRDNGNGYRRIMLDGIQYYAHRLAWFYVTGEWPTFEVDHRDGVGVNNAFGNLRKSTHAENGQNQSLRSTNTSGKHGVSWLKSLGKWEAYIWADGKKNGLGYFDNVEVAGQAYLSAKKNLHQFQPVPRDV